MDKRYQIFISSTFVDLREERKAIIETLLNAKYIPAGMELFSASNDEQFKYIKKIIDTCDYYVLIIGARYGSINPLTGISYTEQEYDYAVSKNIPVLVFIHNDPYNLPVEKREDDKRELLDAFREKVSSGRMCRMWIDTKELVSSVIISLTEIVSENPQLGWTRGKIYDNTELLNQINELRLEKEKNQKEIEMLKDVINQSSVKIDNLACGDDEYTIVGEKKVGYGMNSSYKSFEFTLTWDQIFSAIGPHLISAKGYRDFKSELVESIGSAYGANFSSIEDDCVQTIKIQLSVLNLIKVAPSKAINGAIIEFIQLTEHGKKYLMKSKAIKKKN